MKSFKKSDFDDCEFFTTYRMKFILSNGITKIHDVIQRLESLITLFKKWKSAGVVYDHGAEDDYATFSIKGIDKAIEMGFEMEEKDGSKLLEHVEGFLYLDELNNPIRLEKFND